MTNRSRIAITLLGGLALGVAVATVGPALADRDAVPASSAVPSGSSVARQSAASASPVELRHIAEIMDRVRAEYVDEVSEQAPLDQALRGLVSGLDPHWA